MASTGEQIRDINAKLLRGWHFGNSVLERGAQRSPGAELSGEDQAALKRADDEVTRLRRDRDKLVESATRAQELEGVTEELARAGGPLRAAESRYHGQRVAEFFRSRSAVGAVDIDLAPAARAFQTWRAGARGEEFRAIMTDSGNTGGSLTVPTTVAASVYAGMSNVVAMRRIGCTIIPTRTGSPLRLPRVGTQGLASQVATQATAVAGSDPALGVMTLNAFEAGQLLSVSNDLLTDAEPSLVLDLVASQIGRAIGKTSGAWYVIGSGSGQPLGVMNSAVGASGTVATGGSLLLGAADKVADKLWDLVYSVDPDYRSMGAAWLMRDTTGAVIRKIRVDAGAATGPYAFVPSPTAGLPGGAPDSLLGYPCWFDSNVASMASDARVAAFGDWSGYYIRDVQGLRIERSDQYVFSANQSVFRGILRTDGGLLDVNSVNLLHQSVT